MTRIGSGRCPKIPAEGSGTRAYPAGLNLIVAVKVRPRALRKCQSKTVSEEGFTPDSASGFAPLVLVIFVTYL
jgi:hypothetical protein